MVSKVVFSGATVELKRNDCSLHLTNHINQSHVNLFVGDLKEKLLHFKLQRLLYSLNNQGHVTERQH